MTPVLEGTPCSTGHYLYPPRHALSDFGKVRLRRSHSEATAKGMVLKALDHTHMQRVLALDVCVCVCEHVLIMKR
jgi:hypothetical protein